MPSSFEGMPTKRSKVEVMAEILSFCKQPQKKTRVMSRINLSTKMARKYLKILIAKQLLEVHHSEVGYATTQKGRDFLEKWEMCTKLLRVPLSV